MSKKRKSLKSKAMPRSLAVSLAGIRAGGALAVDSALQRVARRAPGESGFARREAQRFVRELGSLKGTYIKIGQPRCRSPRSVDELLNLLGVRPRPLRQRPQVDFRPLLHLRID